MRWKATWTHVVVMALIFALVVGLDAVPHGTFVAQGDFFQTTDVGRQPTVNLNLFSWMNLSGQGQFNPLLTTAPFYLEQWAAQSFGLSSAQVATLLEAQLIELSYLGMILSVRYGFPLVGSERRTKIQVFAGLLYAFNPITFTFTSYSWGYLHHLLIYPAIPPVVTLVWRVIVAPSRRAWSCLILVLTGTVIAFNNLAWLYSLLLFEGLLGVLAVVIGAVSLRRAIRRGIAVIGLELLMSAVIVVPFYLAQRTYSSKVRGTAAFGGDAKTIIKATSVPLGSLVQGELSPYRFPSIDLMNPHGLLPAMLDLSLLVLAVLLALAGIRALWIGRQAALELSATLVLLVVVILATARITPPLGPLVTPIFVSPVFILLRSPEKIYALLPLTVVMATLAALPLLPRRAPRRPFAVLVVLGLAGPWLFGAVPTYLSTGFRADLLHQDRNGYSVAVRLPRDYTAAAAKLNADPRGGSLLSTPYSAINSLNWSNYPAWRYVGANFLSQLFTRPVISSDINDHPVRETGLSFRDFDNGQGTPQQFSDLLQRFGIRFVMFHRDLAPAFEVAAGPTVRALAALQDSGQVVRLSSTPSFDLYEVTAASVAPAVEIPGGGTFQHQSPVEYDVAVTHLDAPGRLELRQSENPAWKILLEPLSEPPCRPTATYEDNVRGCASHDALDVGLCLSAPWRSTWFDNTHRMVDNYANAWTLDPNIIRRSIPHRYWGENTDGSLRLNLVIYFTPQSEFIYGVGLLAVLTLIGLGGLALDGRRMPHRASRVARLAEA